MYIQIYVISNYIILYRIQRVLYKYNIHVLHTTKSKLCIIIVPLVHGCHMQCLTIAVTISHLFLECHRTQFSSQL